MTRAVILRRARQDVAEASRFYEARRAGLGRAFLSRVDEAVQSICRTPNAFQKVDGADTRIHLIHQFPYVILYRSERDRVVGFAVIHAHRDPQTWPTY